MPLRLSILLALSACAPKAPVAPPAPAEVEVEVTKSPLDGREYAYLELDNGLRALVVSDPDTDLAAAALQVHVGHYADPLDRQGLAHFLEHMLFMGTDRYPGVDEYRAFVEAHGGSTNAGTGPETTTYHFQVEHAALQPAFERFSRFFVAPLLDPAQVERERNAVHAEYTLKLKDNWRRGRQVRKATTNPAHPEAKFSVGNHDTLADREGDPVYEDLRALYAAEYRPDRMAVAIVGREPVETLRSWVVENLSDVPGGPAGAPEPRPALFLDDQVGVRVDIVPADERRELELQFALPPQREVWPARPHGYLSWVLGHEGEGTLFATLKEQGWIESLAASVGELDDVDVFSVDITLTEAGLANVDEVAAAVFEGIELVEAEGIPEVYFHEDRRMAELGFRYLEEMRPVVAARNAVWALQEFPPQHVLDHSAQGAWRPELVADALAQLTPANVRMIVTAPGLETDRVEPLYAVPYQMRPLSDDERAALADGSELAFGLPAENTYLPEDLTLAAGGEAPGVPRRLAVDDPRLDVWHLHDTSWGVPRAVVTTQIYTPRARLDGLRGQVLNHLYESVLDDALVEFEYPLSLAGLHVDVATSDQGLRVDISGYDDRQGRLLADVAEVIRGLEVDPARFEIVRARTVRDWRNLKQARPLSQSHWALGEVLDPWNFDRQLALPIAESVTAEELQAFADTLLDEATARLYVHGNVTEDEARGLADVVATSLLADAAPAERPEVTVRRVPDAELVRDVEIDHGDSTLVIAYQGDDTSPAAHARWQLLGKVLDTPFFSTLRTEQQLGYAVGIRYTVHDRLPALAMGLQSAVVGPVTLEERVDAFFGDYRDDLAAMSAEEFAAIRSGVVATLRERETQLYGQSGEYRTDLYFGVTTFDWDEQVAREVERLEHADVLALYDELLLGDAGRLVVRSFGTAHADERSRATPGCPDTACVVARMPDVVTRKL